MRTTQRLLLASGMSLLLALLFGGAAQAQITPTAQPQQTQGQEQNQDQDVNVNVDVNVDLDALLAPVSLRGGGGKALPKTGLGADAGAMANAGAGSLLIGMALTDFARRRLMRRRGVLSDAPAEVTEASPSIFSEGDLLLPYDQ